MTTEIISTNGDIQRLPDVSAEYLSLLKGAATVERCRVSDCLVGRITAGRCRVVTANLPRTTGCVTAYS